MALTGRDRYNAQSLGGALNSTIKQARVLMVGAGGIGCELLKNLVLTGFGEVHIVDLDTIDLSNLNRQFLFGHEHIKRSKAKVAQESAAKFNPNVKIEAHHANIKDPQFTVDWYKTFAIVFNALDNLEARRHVNRMCLAADVPLIESGTTGFDGQVQPIKKGISECYDCNPKAAPKSFPVCTIRSTPSQPIHCIVWAKSYLFAEIFGTSEEDSPELDASEDQDNAEEIATLKKEAQALKLIRQSMGSEDFPQKIFDKVFKDDIERLQSMEDMWKTRQKPEPLAFDKLSQEALGVGSEVLTNDQAVWTAAENLAVFIASTKKLSDRVYQQSEANNGDVDTPPVLTFDKDDKDTLDFVAASANLRSVIFGIEPRSEFDIKQMAGNIIPAIATTNAMTASLCVLQAFKMLQGNYAKAKTIFLTRSAERAINSESLQPPKPSCVVCGICYSHANVDLAKATMDDLVKGVLQKDLNYGEEITVRLDGNILYDQDLEDNLPKKLSDMKITNNSFLTIVDEADEDPRVDVVLNVVQTTLPDESKPVVLPDNFEIAKKPKSASPVVENGHTNGLVTRDRKRSAGEAGLDPNPEADIVAKKGKVYETNAEADAANNSNNDVIVVDNEDSAIVIDD